MYTLKTTPRTVEERTEVDKRTCDICKQDVRHNSFTLGESSKVKILAKIGNHYPECDCRELHIIDCCPKCFLEKVKPLIENTFSIQFRTMDMEDDEAVYEEKY